MYRRNYQKNAVLWEQWKRAFQNFLGVVAGDELKSISRKAILLNAVNVKGQCVFYSDTSVRTSQPPAAGKHRESGRTQLKDDGLVKGTSVA